MEWITMLQKAICYVETHLLEDIHFDDVARQVNLSPYEFHRSFCFMSGMTLNTYIRNRRLSLAGQELLETDKKIVELAMKYGFESQAGFTKAFTRFHGIAPKYARAAGSQLVLFNPLTINVSFEGGKKIDYRIEQTKQQKFIAVVREFPTEIICDDSRQDIPDFWAECYAKNLIEPMKSLQRGNESHLYGLCAPLREQETSFEYGIGILLNDILPDIDDAFLKANGYRYWQTEPCTYVVFQCIGNDGDCIADAWENFYKEFLPYSAYQSCTETDYEVYFDKNPEGVFCELWIPVKNVSP